MHNTVLKLPIGINFDTTQRNIIEQKQESFT